MALTLSSGDHNAAANIIKAAVRKLDKTTKNIYSNVANLIIDGTTTV